MSCEDGYLIKTDGHTINKTKRILNSEHQYGNIATSGNLFVKYNLSNIVKDYSIYKGELRLGGSSNSSYSFSLLLTVTFGTWCFVIISQSTNKAQLTLNSDTKELTMLVTDKTIGLYDEELILTKMDV